MGLNLSELHSSLCKMKEITTLEGGYEDEMGCCIESRRSVNISDCCHCYGTGYWWAGQKLEQKQSVLSSLCFLITELVSDLRVEGLRALCNRDNSCSFRKVHY